MIDRSNWASAPKIWKNNSPAALAVSIVSVRERKPIAPAFKSCTAFARTEVLLRRPVESRETILTVGALKMDLVERTVQRGDREVGLLPREFKLLEYLMRRPGRAATRAMLFADIWSYDASRFVPQTERAGRVARAGVAGPSSGGFSDGRMTEMWMANVSEPARFIRTG